MFTSNPARRVARALGLAAGALLLAAAPPPAWSAPAAPADKAFAGSPGCRECHAHFYELWAPSHHGTAMSDFALARTNLTPMAEALRVGTNSYQALIPEGVVVERGAGGERRYPMAQAMGGRNVYYFLTPLERGRLQVLPVAYDLRRHEWFDVAGSAVRHFAGMADDPIYWTESQYTFNTACYNCHVSQLTNNYHLDTDTYQTSWAEPGINCETCHGPAAEHARLARETPAGQPLPALKLISLKPFTHDQMNSQCGGCHAKIVPLAGSFTPGDRFFDHFGLGALEQSDFYPDGRDLGENFTYTSWRLSPCAASGKLDCLACHTSSGRYRFAAGDANLACQPCHQEKAANVTAHSHHPAGSAGARCVSCHMPMTEFARMTRTDHSMRPPMPAATVAFGSPNACNLCHTNQTAAWADQLVRDWHPERRDYQAATLETGRLIAAARLRDWSKLPEINRYLASPRRGEVWAASLLALLGGCEDDAKWAGVRACLDDHSPLVRAAAVQALGEGVRPEFIPLLTKAARDPVRLVRFRAANALAGVPGEMIPVADRPAVATATDELVASLLARPDDAGSHYNLGNLRLEQHDTAGAIQAFTAANHLQPRDPAALVNLSLALNQAGQNEPAEASLRSALRLSPTNAAVHLNLGMLLAEIDRMPEAEQEFRESFRRDPKSAQAAFNLGVMLAQSKPAESLDWCRRAVALAPRETKYGYTLAFFLDQQGRTAAAIETLEQLLAPDPPGPDAYALLGRLYEEQSRTSKAIELYHRAAANPRLPRAARVQFEERVTGRDTVR